MLFTKFSRLGAAFATAAMLFCFAHGASANGDLFGTKYCQIRDQNDNKIKTVPLVMGGIGSKLTLKPSRENRMQTDTYTSSGASSWLSFILYKTGYTDLDSLDVIIIAEPDESDRTGYILMKTEQAGGGNEVVDTIYVLQPGTRCMDSKQGNTGNDFFVAFMKNTQEDAIGLHLYATSGENTLVTVRDNGNQSLSTTIDANQVKPIYQVSGSGSALQSSPAYNYQYQKPLYRSLHVTAEKDISLYAYNQEFTSSEMACILPTAALSDEYFALSYYGNYEKPEVLMIIATEDTTLVTITPTDETYGEGTPHNSTYNRGSEYKTAGNPFTIILMKGQTYLIRSKSYGISGSSDYFVKPGLTGTHVKSSKPIAVFGGHERTSIGCNITYNRDHLFEQLLPLRSWGTKYVCAETNQPNNIYRIVAAYDNTIVTIRDKNGIVETLTLNRGKFAERQFNSIADPQNGDRISPFVYIEANQPVQVGLFALSTECTHPRSNIADPFLIALGPADKGIFNAVFSPVKIPEIYGGTPTHYITVITKKRDAAYTTLHHRSGNGQPSLINLDFNEMTGTDYAYASTPVVYHENFNYKLSNPYGFTAYAYGFGYLESYGYTIGAQLGERVVIEGGGASIPDSVVYCYGDTYRPFDTCIGGGSNCTEDREKYYWYNTLEDWYNEKPMSSPPVIDTKVEGSTTYFASWWGRCDILYPKPVTIKVLPLPKVNFPDVTVCQSAVDIDYGGTPAGGKYTYKEGGARFNHQLAAIQHPADGYGEHEVVYTYTNERGCVNRDTAVVTVEVLDRGPRLEEFGDSSFCYGEETTLRVRNAGSRTFQWYHSDLNGANLTPIPRATGASYRIMPDSSGYRKNGGYVKFSVDVTNLNGCNVTLSDTIHIVPYPPKPKLIVNQKGTGCTPSTYTLYDEDCRIEDADFGQWFKNDFVWTNKINGATDDSYPDTARMVGVDVLTNFYVYGVANEVPGRTDTINWCWTTDDIRIEVYPLANVPQIENNGSIASQHEDTVPVCRGDTIKLTAKALDDGEYTWQWWRINPDNTKSRFSTEKEIRVTSGRYEVESISKYGCTSAARSNPVTLIVREKPGTPSINFRGGVKQVCVGDTVWLSAAAVKPDGSNPVTYQWYAVMTNNAYGAIGAAANQTYGVIQNGSYVARAGVTYPGDEKAELVCYSPYSSVQPVELWDRPLTPNVIGNSNVCLTTANISLNASPAEGSVPVTRYSWYKDGLDNANLIPGVNADVYTFTEEKADTIPYYVKAISSNGCVSDEAKKVVTIHDPKMTGITGAKDTCYGVEVTLTAHASENNCTYRWYEHDKLINGESSATYTVKGVGSSTNTYTYYAHAVNKFGCVSTKSDEVSVTIHSVTANLLFTIPTVCWGDTLRLTVTGSGSNKCEWYRESGVTQTRIGETKNGRYAIAPTDANYGSYKYVVNAVLDNSCKAVSSEVATVSPHPPVPNIIPDKQEICFDDSTGFSASSPTQNPTYQWWFSSDSIGYKYHTSGNRIFVKKFGFYKVQVQDANGCWSPEDAPATRLSTYRNPDIPTIKSKPTINLDNDIEVCESAVPEFTASSSSGSGEVMAYQWYSIQNGNWSDNPIGEPTDKGAYTPNASNRYVARAVLTHPGGLKCWSPGHSVPINVKINETPPRPTITAVGGRDGDVCRGDTVTLIATPTTISGATYYWSKGETPLSSTYGNTLKVARIADTGFYKVTVSIPINNGSNSCRSPESPLQKVNIRSYEVSLATPPQTTVCAGAPVSLSATVKGSGGGVSYSWYKDGKFLPNSDIATYPVDATGSYYFTVTDDMRCKSDSSNRVRITVNPNPTQPAITYPDSARCEGLDVLLTAYPSGEGSYQWYFEKNGAHTPVGAPSTNTTLLLSNISAAAAGPYSVSVTRQGCTSSSPLDGKGQVEVLASPATPILSANGTTSSDLVHICDGDSVRFSAFSANASTFEWYADGGKIPGVTGNKLTVGSMPITYSVWSKSEPGCPSRAGDASTIEIHFQPMTPIIQPEGLIRICANGATPIQVSVPGNVSYQWYSVDTATNNRSLIGGANGYKFDVSQSGHYAVRVDQLHVGSGYSLACATYSDPKAVALFPLPLEPLLKGDPTPTGGERVKGCEGDVLKLTASMPVGGGGVRAQVVKYRWYKDSVELSSVFDSTYTITSVEEALYMVKAVSDNECESVASSPKKIAILPLPHVGIADGTRDTCGKSITLSATPAPKGALYDWYKDGSSEPFLKGSTAPSYVVQPDDPTDLTKPTLHDYNLYVTDKDGCRSSSPSPTVRVNIRALPPDPKVAAEPKEGVCLGSDATLKVTVDQPNAGMYKWYKRVNRVLDSIGMISDADFSIREAQLTDAGQYAVEIINTHGCKSAKMGEVNLTVLALPEVRILGKQVCEDWTEKDIVNFATPANGTFNCSFGCENGKFSPLLASQGTAGSVSLTYTFTATNLCENSDKTTIEIINRPNTPIVIAEGETRVCADSVVVTLRADVSDESAAHYTYRWSREGAVLPKEDSSFYTATKAGDYTVKIWNKGLCESKYESDPIRIEVKPLPTAPVIVAENAAFYCPGEATKLLAHPAGEESGSFLWYKGDNREMSEIPGEITENYSAREVGQYAVKLFGAKDECWSPFSNFITVGEYPLPKQPEIIASQTTLYAGLDYKLLVKSPQTDETYEWYKSNLSIDASGVTVPISNLNGDDTGRYTVRVTDQHGCVVESEAYELGWSETDLFIPNVFTPNGDGINDNFQILGLDRFVEHKLQIMNKQRVVIFTQKNYSNEWNGESYPNDVYYYILELKHQDGGKKTVYGYVHLKR